MFLKRCSPKFKEVIKQALYEEVILPYNVESLHILQQHIARYVFAALFSQGARATVLGIGCGCGYGSCYLSTKAKKVLAGDLSKDLVRIASKFYKGENNQFLTFDAHHLPFKERSFDLITCFEVIEHLRDQEGFLAECRRVLKGAGIFICLTPNREVASPASVKPSNPFHLKEFNAEEFYQILTKFFREVSIYAQLIASERKGLNISSKFKTILYFLVRSLPFASFLHNVTIGKIKPRYKFVRLSDYNIKNFR